MSNETKVGIFVVAIIITFIVLLLKIGELNLSKPDTYTMTMVFSTVEGLKVGSQLEMAGVQIGTVERIALNRNYSAVVTAAVNEDVKIPIDSVASIATKGVLGDKIIVIKPGSSKNTIEPEGNLPRTTIPPSLDTLLEQLGQIAGNLTELTGSLNATLGDEETMRSILTNIQKLSEDSSTLVAENKDNISIVITNLKDITAAMAEASESFTGSSRSMNEILANINSGNGTIGKLVYDDRLYESLTGSLESLHKLTANIQEENTISLLLSDPTLYYNLVSISENVRTVTGNLATGKGTLGKLLSDDELYNNMNEAVRNVNTAAQGLGEQLPITVMGTIMGFIW
ncbi:MAG TPA: MlaD family protein [Deltaproteobacteria bacterium]|nr:MlaD family protein [Deltaproteobacteria bacterium]HQI00105.1 MlaD family protein [Deltaproteobacteria bacterium]HQJ07784.1 MlaD family protein [Deltaproteobacteria bacterium]